MKTTITVMRPTQVVLDNTIFATGSAYMEPCAIVFEPFGDKKLDDYKPESEARAIYDLIRTSTPGSTMGFLREMFSRSPEAP